MKKLKKEEERNDKDEHYFHFKCSESNENKSSEWRQWCDSKWILSGTKSRGWWHIRLKAFQRCREKSFLRWECSIVQIEWIVWRTYIRYEFNVWNLRGATFTPVFVYFFMHVTIYLFPSSDVVLNTLGYRRYYWIECITSNDTWNK